MAKYQNFSTEEKWIFSAYWSNWWVSLQWFTFDGRKRIFILLSNSAKLKMKIQSTDDIEKRHLHSFAKKPWEREYVHVPTLSLNIQHQKVLDMTNSKSCTGHLNLLVAGRILISNNERFSVIRFAQVLLWSLAVSHGFEEL